MVERTLTLSVPNSIPNPRYYPTENENLNTNHYYEAYKIKRHKLKGQEESL